MPEPPQEAESESESETTAVTVIGGYLGAGKTTLVNHILRTADARVAVLVNDFGDINIDEDLIESDDGDTISLANGCICCSLIDGFAAALRTVRELDPPPERLVIEASGVADPAGVAAYGHGPGLTLDAVVVVVDGETVKAKAGDKYVGDTVVGQLRSADIIVLNKLDLIDPSQAGALEQWLKGHAPTAIVHGATRSEVDPTLLFGTVPPSPDGTGHDHGTHDLAAESVFESWSWESTQSIDRARIERLMDDLPDSVVRAKGVVMLNDAPQRYAILQRVGGRWTLRPGEPLPDALPDEDATSRLVFIGTTGAIDDEWLTARLSS